MRKVKVIKEMECWGGDVVEVGRVCYAKEVSQDIKVFCNTDDMYELVDDDGNTVIITRKEGNFEFIDN